MAERESAWIVDGEELTARRLAERYAPDVSPRVLKRFFPLLKRAHDVAARRTAGGEPDVEAAAEWLEAVFARLGALRLWAAAGRWKHKHPRVAGLEQLLLVVRAVPGLSDAVGAIVRCLLASTTAVRLLTQAGLPSGASFVAELAHRIGDRVLPRAPDPRELVELVALLFRKRADVEWLARLDDEHLAALTHVLAAEGEESPWRRLREDAGVALRILALRAASVGLDDDMRARAPRVPIEAWPFLALAPACDAFLAAPEGAPRREARARLLAVVDECHAVVADVLRHVEEEGVSVSLVYRLDVITQTLARVSSLAALLSGAPPREAFAFLAELGRAALRDRRVGALLSSSTRLIAKKVIERAGHTGEHYITSTRGEWLRMLASAAGGGLLTTGTIAVKVLLGALTLAPFGAGALASINYAVSFVVMQLCGFTLATKQPSATAATLAGAIKERARGEDLSPLVDIIARITRSQLAAALGNIGVVIPAALAFDAAVRAMTGKPFLSVAKAQYTVGSLHLTESGTLAYAALTGVLLWCSSIAAGWLENWSTYRHLPEAIAKHRGLARLVGRRGAERLSRFVAHNVSGFGGNTALGVLLGMTPVLGAFFGLPLDVRHVTLSTGSLALAASTLGAQGLPSMLPSVLGIAAIGTLNFGVSFALALGVAWRARDVPSASALRLLLALAKRFVARPGMFVFPPREEAAVVVERPAEVVERRHERERELSTVD